jgi:hypothetical protein
MTPAHKDDVPNQLIMHGLFCEKLGLAATNGTILLKFGRCGKLMPNRMSMHTFTLVYAASQASTRRAAL